MAALGNGHGGVSELDLDLALCPYGPAFSPWLWERTQVPKHSLKACLWVAGALWDLFGGGGKPQLCGEQLCFCSVLWP